MNMTYKSAHDLPSFVELSKQLKGVMLLRFLLPKNKRSELKKLEAQLKEMGDTVDDFYKLLGDRHWIFHDLLNLVQSHKSCSEKGCRGIPLPRFQGCPLV